MTMNHFAIKLIGCLIIFLLSFIVSSSGQENFDNNDGSHFQRKRSGVIVSIQKIRGNSENVAMVINDSSYILSKQCLLLDHQGKEVSLTNLEPGMLVNFFTIKMMITEIIVSEQQLASTLKKNETDFVVKKKQRVRIYKEGNVWKN